MNTNTYLSASDPDIRKPEEPERLIPPSYRIDPAWYEQQGRSLSLLLTQRMCKDSLAKLGERREVRVPVEEPSTQRVRFKRKTSTFGDDPLAIIQECCSKTDDYRDPRLPIKELLCRLLLAGGNRPQTVEELYEGLKAWVGIGDTRVIFPEVIQRLMERDDYYGFAQVPEEGS